MRREIEEREPERDPALAAALLQAYADAPVPPQRLEALRARIRERAETLSAVAPARSPQPAHRPAWSGRARPLAPAVRRLVWAAPALLAATVTGVLLLGRGGRPGAPVSPAPIPGVGYATPEQALTSTVSDAEFARTVADGSNPAALLAVAVGAGPVRQP